MEEIQTVEQPELIAVPSGPFYLSQANAEFKQNGWASNILAAAGVPAPRYLSALMGKSFGSHQMHVGAQYSSYGLGQGFGSLAPNSVQGFQILELYYNTSGSSWFFYLNGFVSDERIWVEVPNGPSVLFEFEYSSAGYPIAGDVHGLGQYLVNNAGSTIGLNIYGS